MFAPGDLVPKSETVESTTYGEQIRRGVEYFFNLSFILMYEGFYDLG